jgi:hypothetical protein
MAVTVYRVVPARRQRHFTTIASVGLRYNGATGRRERGS